MFDTSLISSIVSASAITELGSKLAPLSAFSTNFGDEAVKARSSVQVSLVEADGIEKNPSNWQTDNTTVGKTTVTTDILSRSFELPYDALQKGSQLTQIIKGNAQAFAEGVIAEILKPVTTANYQTAPISPTAPSDMGTDDLRELWGFLTNSPRVCLLDQSYYANYLPDNMLAFDVLDNKQVYGFDYFDAVSPKVLNTTAESNLIGFAGAPTALAIATRLPETNEAIQDAMVMRDVIEVPELGIFVEFAVWLDVATRSTWGAFSVAAGSAVGMAKDGSVILHS